MNLAVQITIEKSMLEIKKKILNGETEQKLLVLLNVSQNPSENDYREDWHKRGGENKRSKEQQRTEQQAEQAENNKQNKYLFLSRFSFDTFIESWLKSKFSNVYLLA